MLRNLCNMNCPLSLIKDFIWSTPYSDVQCILSHGYIQFQLLTDPVLIWVERRLYIRMCTKRNSGISILWSIFFTFSKSINVMRNFGELLFPHKFACHVVFTLRSQWFHLLNRTISGLSHFQFDILLQNWGVSVKH